MQFIEVAVLKTAKAKGCRHFPNLYDYVNFYILYLNFKGDVPQKFHFMALTLLGKDLYYLRKEQQTGKFTLSTALRIGIQTMRVLLNTFKRLFKKFRL